MLLRTVKGTALFHNILVNISDEQGEIDNTSNTNAGDYCTL